MSICIDKEDILAIESGRKTQMRLPAEDMKLFTPPFILVHEQEDPSNVLKLEVSKVIPDLLHNITSSDAMKEGIMEEGFYPDDGYPLCSGYTHEYKKVREGLPRALENTAQNAFKDLWEERYGNWDDNPSVLVYHFKLVKEENK